MGETFTASSWPKEKQEEIKLRLKIVAERAKERFGAEDVYILATFRDGNNGHAFDGQAGEWQGIPLSDLLAIFSVQHANVEQGEEPEPQPPIN